MQKSLDITITLCIVGQGDIPAGTFIAALDALSRSIFLEERREIDALQKAIKEWPAAVFTTMRERLERLGYGRALNIEGADGSPLTAIGAVAGLAWWVADSALGEKVNDAWKASDSHDRLENFFKSRVFYKRDRIAKRFSSQRLRLKEDFSSYQMAMPGDEPSLEIAVIPARENPAVPRPGQRNHPSRGGNARRDAYPERQRQDALDSPDVQVHPVARAERSAAHIRGPEDEGWGL